MGPEGGVCVGWNIRVDFSHVRKAIAVKQDWRKFVTLNPPNLVKFKVVEEDLDSSDPTKGPDEALGCAYIEIINKSMSNILFKVKTTNITNYLVRPNAEIVP